MVVLACYRQTDDEFGPSRYRVDLHRTVMLTLDDTGDDVQPQTGAFANALSSKKGIENIGPDTLRYPGTVVDDRDPCEIMIFQRADGQLSPAIDLHGIHGIVDEVGPYLV